MVPAMGRSHRLVSTAIRLAFTVAAACGGSSVSAPGPAPAAGAPADPCPEGTVQSAEEQGGACLQPAVLGEEVVNACGAYLEQSGWQPDPVATAAIGERMGQTVRCWRAPAR